MIGALSVITIDIPPTFHVGPLTLAWHGLTIGVGIAIGGLAAAPTTPAAGSERGSRADLTAMPTVRRGLTYV
jgi:prolipoprotein diacylglyceryltransferase